MKIIDLEKISNNLKKNLVGGTNNEIQKLCIESGIIKSLLEICSSRNFELITQPYVDALASFTYPNEDFVSSAMNTIDNIIYYGAIGTDSTQIHPYFEDLNQIEGTKKIFQLFRRTKYEYTKNVSATCIGIVFRAQEMIEPEMKVDVIDHLKSIIKHADQDIRKLVNLALKCLALNSSNRAEIEKDGYQLQDD